MPFTASQTFSFTGTTWNEVPGVYGIMNVSRQMIYIGQTDNFKRRMDEHQADTRHCMHRYGPALVWAEVIAAAPVRTARERELILEYRPPCNQY
jgi:predicted GIY-YIG superfamily endonuclease